MFSRIVVLSLDRRAEHRGRLKQHFADFGLECQLFIAGNGHLLPADQYNHVDDLNPPVRQGYPAWVNRTNSYNCSLCYKKIITQAQKDNLSEIILCEDDVELQPNFWDIVKPAFKELETLPSWDMFYFTANHKWVNQLYRYTNIPLSQHIMRLGGSFGFQMVAIRKTLFQAIIDSPLRAPMDQVAAEDFHPHYNCYGIWPQAALPLPGFSECEGYYLDVREQYSVRGY